MARHGMISAKRKPTNPAELALITQLRALFDNPPSFNDFRHHFICWVGRDTKWADEFAVKLTACGIAHRYMEERPGRTDKPFCGFVFSTDADIARAKALRDF